MTFKDFDRWNTEKKHVNEKDKQILFHEREIWWCTLGLNIGSEQDGSNEFFDRPVLVIKRFNRDILWVLPLTTSGKLGTHYYQIENSFSWIILSQIRLISSKRLLRKKGIVGKKDFIKIIDKVKNFFPK